MGKLQRVGYNVNKMSQELKDAVFDIGVDILGELAERVAEEARTRAPKNKSIEYKKGKDSIPKRRGPNKKGATDSGPISDNIEAVESPNVRFSYLVISYAWYSHLVEFGTEEHDIFPKKKKALRYPISESETIIRGSVHHPGIKNHVPFLRPAADKAETFLREILQERGIKV